jgi:DNA-directed RNA polymerase specialized sigma24 family protein
MKGNNPPQENRMDWMIHNNLIDDATLVEAMLSEFYAGLHGFIFSLSGQPQLASAAGQQAIAQAVMGRHRFWNENSLRAWLYRLAYLHLQKDLSQGKSIFSQSLRVARKSPASPNVPPQDKTARLYLENRLPALLSYGHGLEQAEIAYILGETTSDLHSYLNQNRLNLYLNAYPTSQLPEDHDRYIDLTFPPPTQSLSFAEQLELEQHLPDCRFCQDFRQRLPDLEKGWRNQFKPATLQPELARIALREIRSLVTASANGRKHLLPVKEISLVIVVLLTLVLFGRTQGVFETIDSRPTYTARPSTTSLPTRIPPPTRTPAPRPVELNGYEGQDYFYYDTWTVDGDTWETMASKAGLRVELVRYLNPNLPDLFPRSTRITLVGLKSSNQFLARADSLPTPPPPLLTASSSPDEILQRARQSVSSWNTLFVDQVFVSYGPPGYSGPPLQNSRIQIYASQPHHWISIQGILDSQKGYLSYGIGDWIFRRTPSQGRFSAVWNPGGFQGSSSPLSTSYLTAGGKYQNAGEDMIVGRPAIMLDWFNEAGSQQQRLWFDAHTGLLLKYEIFNGQQEDIILYSMAVMDVRYDIPFPEDLFYPPGSGYLQFIGGHILDEQHLSSIGGGILSPRPAPPRKIAPPPSFDAAQNPILLQFPVSSSASTEPTPLLDPEYLDFQEELIWKNTVQKESKVQVYAGPYHLGELDLENTIFSACQRSPDGKSVALLTSKDRSRSSLAWFDLSSLKIHNVTELAGGSTEFAFSPTSRQLAFANCRMSCSVSVLDLQSGAVRSLGPVYDWISSLEWSPDGGQLAFMTIRGALGPRVHVVDLVTGQEIHVGEYDFDTQKMITPGSPVELWEVPYPNQQVELGCMLP